MSDHTVCTRRGEHKTNHLRSSRCRQLGDKWFTRTREGELMGPFRDKSTAEFASRNLADFMQLAPPSLRESLSNSLQR